MAAYGTNVPLVRIGENPTKKRGRIRIGSASFYICCAGLLRVHDAFAGFATFDDLRDGNVHHDPQGDVAEDQDVDVDHLRQHDVQYRQRDRHTHDDHHREVR